MVKFMECILERHGDYETVATIKKPKTYLQDSCKQIDGLGANFSPISKIFENMGKCLPQISSKNKCDALLAWTQSIYFKYEHLDYHYHPQGDMLDYLGEIFVVQDRCEKLESYMKKVGSGKYLLPPECGTKERDVAKIIFDAHPNHDLLKKQTEGPVAASQGRYFKSLESDFDCPRPHSICGEQLSHDPAEL